MAAMASSQVLACGSSMALPARSSSSSGSSKKTMKMMSSYGGLKAHNEVCALSTARGTEQEFARIAAQARSSASSMSRRGGGGAASSTCSIADEVFRVVPIMSGLVLIGISIGFLLLRVEAALEESEE